MKKTVLFLTLVIACCAAPAKAQTATTFSNPFNMPHFGIRVGGDIVCPGSISADNVGLKVFSSGGGIEFGAIYNLPLIANFYIEPGLKFYYNRYSMKKDFIDMIDDSGVISNVSFNKYGLRIPVMAGYRFDIAPSAGLHLFTGPEFEIGISAKEHVGDGSHSASADLYGDDGGMRRADILWSIGAGISTGHFIFSVAGSFGMLNMYDITDVSFHENRVTFSVGYNF